MRRRILIGHAVPTSQIGVERCGGVAVNETETHLVASSKNMKPKKMMILEIRMKLIMTLVKQKSKDASVVER
jgi:hypothetical protein